MQISDSQLSVVEVAHDSDTEIDFRAETPIVSPYLLL